MTCRLERSGECSVHELGEPSCELTGDLPTDTCPPSCPAKGAPVTVGTLYYFVIDKQPPAAVPFHTLDPASVALPDAEDLHVETCPVVKAIRDACPRCGVTDLEAPCLGSTGTADGNRKPLPYRHAGRPPAPSRQPRLDGPVLTGAGLWDTDAIRRAP